jgi:hypothetical protein
MTGENESGSYAGADDPAAAAFLDAVDAVIGFGDRKEALEQALDRCADFAVGHAYAAFAASLLGHHEQARSRSGIARSLSRSIVRRERQLVEILVLTAEGDRARAAGLAAEHILEFSQDTRALDTIVHWFETNKAATDRVARHS